MDERDYPPIKCNCGNYEEERKNVHQEEIDNKMVDVTFMRYCKNCGKYLGCFEYGVWSY